RSWPFFTGVPESAINCVTTPSRCAATSTWFSTIIGPEATKSSEEFGAVDAPAGIASARAGCAAETSEGIDELLQPAKSSAHIINGETLNKVFIRSYSTIRTNPTVWPRSTSQAGGT